MHVIVNIECVIYHFLCLMAAAVGAPAATAPAAAVRAAKAPEALW